MNTETKTKFQAGQEVYWLSSKGFVKGVIKMVDYKENVAIKKTTVDGKPSYALGLKTKVQSYYCWNPSHQPEYHGDLIAEHEIFTDKQSMIDYYANKQM